jgi:hypothetical protein
VDGTFSDTLIHGRGRSESTSVEMDEMVLELPVKYDL